MKSSILWIIGALLILQISCVQAAIEEYEVTFDIQPDKSVRETFEILLDEPRDEYTFSIAGEFSELRVTDGVKPIPFKVETNSFSVVSIPGNTRTIHISFAKNDLIFQNNEILHFFARLNIPPAGKATIKVILPTGYVLHNNIINPEDAAIGSDGERISFTWSFTGEIGNFPISIQFTSLRRENFAVWFVPPISVMAVILVFLYFRKKSRENFLLQFYEDERKVVADMIKLKQAYQNTLQRRHHFSRSKMTRFIQKLEKRGLVKSEKVGRTKRIYWMKGK